MNFQVYTKYTVDIVQKQKEFQFTKKKKNKRTKVNYRFFYKITKTTAFFLN